MSLYTLGLVPEGEGDVLSLGRVSVERAVQGGGQQRVEEERGTEVPPRTAVRQLSVEAQDTAHSRTYGSHSSEMCTVYMYMKLSV